MPLPQLDFGYGVWVLGVPSGSPSLMTPILLLGATACGSSFGVYVNLRLEGGKMRMLKVLAQPLVTQNFNSLESAR
jgi:hypothetical protein